MSGERLRALIVDDEPLARERLRALILAAGDVDIVAECADGRDAVTELARSAVDLVFLDVEMPRLDGFGVVREIGVERMPPVIFTSAYSEFAVRAFEAYALDYLLKPFDNDRFALALRRGRQEVEAAREARARSLLPAATDPRMLGLLQYLGQHETPRYPDAIAIRAGGQYTVVRVADVDWIEADGNYSRLYVQQRPRLLTKTLTMLEREVLDPRTFVRVHRSAIVNTTKIATLDAHVHGELTLVLHDGTRVECSRRYRKHLESSLYFTT